MNPTEAELVEWKDYYATEYGMAAQIIVRLIAALRAERELSERRRALLASYKAEDWPRGIWGPFCPWCRKYQPWGGEESPMHDENCAMVAAIKVGP